MASIKLKHASGNSTILNSPAANPSADVTLKLPSTTGSAGQVLKVASANHSSTNAELEFAADAGKLLGQYFATSTAEFSSSSGSFQSAHSITLTPVSTSSKFLIIYMPARLVTNGSSDNEIHFSDGSNNPNIQYRIAAGGSTYKNPSLVFFHNYTISGSTTFTAKYRNISGNSDSIILGDNGSSTNIVVLEIEQ